jgi:hypothetical protein
MHPVARVSINIYRNLRTFVAYGGFYIYIDCEMLRIQHFLDNQLTDGGKVVSTGRALLSTNISFLLPALIDRHCGLVVRDPA